MATISWSTKKEKLLKYWQEECRLYSWLYSQNVQYYQSINRNLSIFSIFLSAITGATLLNNTEEPNPNLILGFGLVSIVASFLQGLRQFLDLDSKISLNTLVSRQNSGIVIDIEEQLNLARDERLDSMEFIKTIKARKNEIIQNAPIISKSRWTQLLKKIERGEGISFFNHNAFKSYLETTVGINDLNLDTGGEESGSTPVTTTPNFRVGLPPEEASPVPAVTPPRVYNEPHGGDAHSEDELIETLQNENRCTTQLREVYSSSRYSMVPPTPVNVGTPGKQQQHKLNPVLSYHMSRM